MTKQDMIAQVAASTPALGETTADSYERQTGAPRAAATPEPGTPHTSRSHRAVERAPSHSPRPSHPGAHCPLRRTSRSASPLSHHNWLTLTRARPPAPGPRVTLAGTRDGPPQNEIRRRVVLKAHPVLACPQSPPHQGKQTSHRKQIRGGMCIFWVKLVGARHCGTPRTPACLAWPTPTGHMPATDRGAPRHPGTQALHTHPQTHTHTHTHTHGRRDKQGTAKGGLSVLDLVRCKAEQNQKHVPPALGAFLQCEGQTEATTQPHSGTASGSVAEPEACRQKQSACTVCQGLDVRGKSGHPYPALSAA